jgi:hypothetical protein
VYLFFSGVVLVTIGSQSSSGLRFPSADYTKTMNEHSPRYSEVVQVRAEYYGGVVGVITYSIVNGNDGQTFNINSQSGSLVY